jgi:hypothetical protein
MGSLIDFPPTMAAQADNFMALYALLVEIVAPVA